MIWLPAPDSDSEALKSGAAWRRTLQHDPSSYEGAHRTFTARGMLNEWTVMHQCVYASLSSRALISAFASARSYWPRQW